MIEIINAGKTYKTKAEEKVALKNINLNFKNQGLVIITGESGSGKTTLLNILGGLDRYDSGDLVINNKSTKKFKDNNWDFLSQQLCWFYFPIL